MGSHENEIVKRKALVYASNAQAACFENESSPFQFELKP